MCADIATVKRTRQYTKTIPKTGRVSEKKNGLNRDDTMKSRGGYRSHFELGIAKSLRQKGVIFEYEKRKVTFVPKPRTYTPDFYFPSTDVYVEAKGKFDKNDRVKMLLVKEQNPDLDIRILFQNARNKIYKGSKTTYGAWADRHGFEWSEGSIPEEWYKNGRK